ncbi:DHHA1 domain-containing protein [Novosphingobium sp.]|uniref:DHHA1 domain-containing protein n=1 Tax=Novosphingobium sp. TaxID=1874826 RepID=UPI00286DDCBE|nr:DHHA1 domain-containing protein [Novosphingobium sp.]
MTYQPDMMIYHANCADGFGAAWAAWLKWGDAVEYVPCSYGQEPPEVLGKHVLIGDFSFKRDAIERIAPGAASITILDHHETAEAELAPWRRFAENPHRFTMPVVTSMAEDLRRNEYPVVNALFDMNRSGARMVWDFCFPGEEAPALIQFIEDRDLWRFTMQATKPFGVWLRCEPFDFHRWEEIARDLADPVAASRIFSEASAMQRFFDQKVAEIGRLHRLGDIGGYSVPICNCPPMFASEVGHWLLDQYESTPFVACYSDQPHARGYSLRSRDDRLSVSEIARKFGGGGHRNAAGFGVPLP